MCRASQCYPCTSSPEGTGVHRAAQWSPNAHDSWNSVFAAAVSVCTGMRVSCNKQNMMNLKGQTCCLSFDLKNSLKY